MRYSTQALPTSRFIPGRGPRPSRTIQPPAPLHPEEWWDCDDYLHAIDLFNAGYYWECHEVLEGLWKAAGKRGALARFLQGLIQIAASRLRGSAELAQKGYSKFAGLPSPFLGVELGELKQATVALRIPPRLP